MPFHLGGGLNRFLSIYLLGGGALLNSRAPKGPYGRVPKGPMVEHLKVLSLTVEPAYASLTVEHLKVMAALTVEPAYASSPSWSST